MKASDLLVFNIAQLLLIAKKILDYLEDKWEASAAGYVNQGSDPRYGGRLGGFLQHVFSFRPKTFKANPYSPIYKDNEIFIGNPPYLVINIPLNDGNYLHFRAGWRYDVNATETGTYIASIALKILDRPLIYK